MTCARQILTDQFTGRQFYVFSIAEQTAISEPTDFNSAFDEMEALAYAAGGSCNGMDILEFLCEQ